MKSDLSLSPFGVSIGDLVDAARVAEAEGFDGVWTYDHVSGVAGGSDSVLDPWIVLAAIACATERVTVGPLVLNATIRHPAHIAVAAATLQQLAEGRLLLGMGAGAGADRFGAELDIVGLPRLPAAVRRARTEQAIQAVRTLWRGAPTHVTPHHPPAGTTGFLRPEPEPPIVVGVNGPKMAALAGRAADGVNIHSIEEDLEGLAAIARHSSGDPGFQITAEAPLDEMWLAGAGRDRLEALGATRVMYQWRHGLGTDAIRKAARHLGR